MSERTIGDPYPAPYQDPRFDEPTAEEEQYWRELRLGRTL